MILHMPSKLTVLHTSSEHPRTYCLALLAIKRSQRKTGSNTEFVCVYVARPRCSSGLKELCIRAILLRSS